MYKLLEDDSFSLVQSIQTEHAIWDFEVDAMTGHLWVVQSEEPHALKHEFTADEKFEKRKDPVTVEGIDLKSFFEGKKF